MNIMAGFYVFGTFWIGFMLGKIHSWNNNNRISYDKKNGFEVHKR